MSSFCHYALCMQGWVSSPLARGAPRPPPPPAPSFGVRLVSGRTCCVAVGDCVAFNYGLPDGGVSARGGPSWIAWPSTTVSGGVLCASAPARHDPARSPSCSPCPRSGGLPAPRRSRGRSSVPEPWNPWVTGLAFAVVPRAQAKKKPKKNNKQQTTNNNKQQTANNKQQTTQPVDCFRRTLGQPAFGCLGCFMGSHTGLTCLFRQSCMRAGFAML